MENTNAAYCPICKKNESAFYMSTKALMHETNNELYTFNICNNCETVFLTNPVNQERLDHYYTCLLYTSPSPRDRQKSRMPSSA